MMAYSNDGTQISSKFTVSVPPIASASASAWGEWENEGTVHTRCWPQFRPPPPDTPELEPFDDIPREIPEQYNQCVFIRYYTMRRRAFMFPKVIRAAAGPHDPGPGNNPDDILPEPMVQSNSDASNEFDDGENSTIDRSGLVTDDDSELEIFHNVASVCQSSHRFFCPYLFTGGRWHDTPRCHRRICLQGVSSRRRFRSLEFINILVLRIPKHKPRWYTTMTLPSCERCDQRPFHS